MGYRPKTNRVNRRLIDLDNVDSIKHLRADLEALVKDVERFDAGNARVVANDLQPMVTKAIQELQYYPPPRPGSKYKRTYKLRRGWVGSVTTRGASVRILFDNAVPYRRFVQGLIGLGVSSASLKRYTAPIQRYHLETGWRPAAPIIARHVTAMREYALQTSSDRVIALTAKHLSK